MSSPKPAPTFIKKLLRWAIIVPYLIWEFTRSNFNTFVIPNTVFGLLGAFVPAFSAVESHGPPSTKEILLRLPIILGFNWYNVLVFDLGNQRSVESIREDVLNKPWRPIPTGKVTQDQTRRALLLLIPISMCVNYALGVWEQAVLVPILSYLYNDLRGGDEIIRDPIISVAYAVANSASLKIAVGGRISAEAFAWVAMISGVILTTMQVQDLKDKAGDRSRGRRTVALFMGDLFSRTSIAFFVGFWSLVCTRFWDLGLVGFALPGLSGINVIRRVLFKRSTRDDSRTWKWWCLWTVALYSLPVFKMGYEPRTT
ncbi:UbiA prenyltransferase family-domain-containing protein [Hypoxylon fuscum]|nr:UbiA prenyltransferase family-domain-containing protein [Hypoxylon fuscum]